VIQNDLLRLGGIGAISLNRYRTGELGEKLTRILDIALSVFMRVYTHFHMHPLFLDSDAQINNFLSIQWLIYSWLAFLLTWRFILWPLATLPELCLWAVDYCRNCV